MKQYKVGDRIFYESYPEKEICTDIVKKVTKRSYLSDSGKEISYNWLTLWEEGNSSSGIEDYNCLPYSDPRVKELAKKLAKFDKEKENIIDSILEILSPYNSLAVREVLDVLKIRLCIKD